MLAENEKCEQSLILRDVTVDGYESQDILFKNGAIIAIAGEIELDTGCAVEYTSVDNDIHLSWRE